VTSSQPVLSGTSNSLDILLLSCDNLFPLKRANRPLTPCYTNLARQPAGQTVYLDSGEEGNPSTFLLVGVDKVWWKAIFTSLYFLSFQSQLHLTILMTITMTMFNVHAVRGNRDAELRLQINRKTEMARGTTRVFLFSNATS